MCARLRGIQEKHKFLGEELAHRVPITIRLEGFEGPLDLLLYLIQSNELDISKVSITKITDQYLSYVRLMQELNFDIASDFLVMAATLLLWKSKALLPHDGEENSAGLSQEDGELTQEELLRQLMEHQRFLAAGEELSQLPRLGEDVFIRPNLKPPTEKVWKDDMSVTTIALTFQEMIARARRRKHVLRKETVSLSEKIIEFSQKLEPGTIQALNSFISPYLDAQNVRPETVVTFLATLELGRLRKMRLYQEGVYQPIYVELLESLVGFDAKLASGFDAEKTEQANV